MHQCRTTYSKALLLSVIVHVAVAGSALAFAYYGGTLYPRGLRSFTVSLVGPADGAGTGGSPVKGRPVERTAESLPSAVRDRMPEAEIQSGISEQRTVSRGDPAGAVDGQGYADGPDGPSEGGNAAGYTSEQWMRLSTALERVKVYPRLARERGIEGTVLVRFKVQPTGGIDRVDIVKSSGVKILDDASVSTVYRAAPVPYVDGWVEVPMVYQLRRSEVR